MSIVSEFADGLDVSGGSGKSIENLSDSSSWLHGDDSELIFFVNPNEESLLVIMEDTSTRWPVSVEVACLQESVTLFEKEMIINQFLLIFFVHALEWVESTFKISSESAASLNDFVHDFESLLFGDTWTEWVVSHVSSNSDSSAVNHSAILSAEFSIDETCSVHVGDVACISLVAVILLNDLIKKFVEAGVSIVRSSIKTNS